MRFFLVFFFLVFGLTTFSQFFRASIEPYVGFNYYHSVSSNYEWEAYQGVESNLGIKIYTHLGNRFSVAGAVGLLDNPTDGDYFGNITAKCSFLRNQLTGFSCFAEAGIEISDYQTSLPFYLGTSQNFGNGISFNFRVRIPTFIDVQYFYDVTHFTAGVEFGLQFAIPKFRKPKPLTVFGNPFILD